MSLFFMSTIYICVTRISKYYACIVNLFLGNPKKQLKMSRADIIMTTMFES